MNTSFRSSSRFASLAVCAVIASSMSLGGCVADGTIEGDEAIVDEEMVEETSDALMVNTTSTVNLTAAGGTQGLPFASTLCPAGYVATGLNVNTGTWVNNVQMQCTLLNDDGTFGATTVTVKQGGTKMAGTAVSGSCPAGQALSGQVVGVGTDGTGGVYVGKLGGQCSSLSRILADASGFDSTVGPFGSRGTIQQATCPAGSAVVGFYGRSGWWMDRIGFICAEVVMPHVAAYPVDAQYGQPASINSVNLNASGLQAINVAPGATVNFNATFDIAQWSGCASQTCINQIIVGLGPNTLGAGGENPKGCIYNGIPSTSGTSGSGSISFTAPTVPGIYPIRFHTAAAYSCDLNWWTIDFTPSASDNIGFINVF